MKRTIKILMGLIALVLMSFAASSCSKSAVDSKNIIGSWKLVNLFYVEYVDGEITNSVDDDCSYWYFIFEFKADGTGRRTSYNSKNGETTVYPITSWKIKGNKIEMNEVEDNVPHLVKMDIDELSENTLIFSGTVEYGTKTMYVKYTYNKI